jgi:hypothetical protein
LLRELTAQWGLAHAPASLVTDNPGAGSFYRAIEFPLCFLSGEEVAMQLHLETDELNLLANLLMEPPGETSRARLDERLLEMVLARDLRFDSDELGRMAALLAADEHRHKRHGRLRVQRRA